MNRSEFLKTIGATTFGIFTVAGGVLARPTEELAVTSEPTLATPEPVITSGISKKHLVDQYIKRIGGRIGDSVVVKTDDPTNIVYYDPDRKQILKPRNGSSIKSTLYVTKATKTKKTFESKLIYGFNSVSDNTILNEVHKDITQKIKKSEYGYDFIALYDIIVYPRIEDDGKEVYSIFYRAATLKLW